MTTVAFDVSDYESSTTMTNQTEHSIQDVHERWEL